jgi:hypothetical protein
MSILTLNVSEGEGSAFLSNEHENGWADSRCRCNRVGKHDLSLTDVLLSGTLNAVKGKLKRACPELVEGDPREQRSCEALRSKARVKAPGF